MPTQEQLNNRLNPTPVTYNVATSGLFRGRNDFGSSIYYKDPTTGQTSSFSLLDPKNGLYDAGTVGSGNQASQALSRLQSQYGFDWNSLPAFVDGDIQSTGNYQGDITSLLSKARAGTTTNTINGPGTVDPNSVLPNVPGQTTQPTNTAQNPQQVNAQPGQPGNQGPNAQANTSSGTDPNAPQNAQNGATGTPNSAVAPGAALGYTGPSIVDYLNSVGKPSDFSTRAELAKQNGIANYTGTATQNTQLLNTLRSTNAPVVTNPAANASGLTVGTSPAGTTQSSSGVVDKYANLDPISKQVQMYTDAATALGLPTIKQQFDKVVKDQADLTEKMNEQIANVRNNPWLSQGIADKEVQKIQDKNKTQLDTLTHLETLYDSMYKTGQAQVENIVSGAVADVKAANELAQKQLDAASALAKDNVVVVKDGRQLLVSKATGKFVADLGTDPNPPKAGSNADSIAQQNQKQADDVAAAVLDFQNRMQTLKQKGANPDAYAYYKSQLTKNYGASAALALDSAMKTAGITVDYGK